MRGPPPKPTKLKILQGNRGKRALPKDEPQPQGEVVKPSWLRPKASSVWDEISPVVIGMGLLTAADVQEFGRLCSLYAEFRRNPPAFPASKHARIDLLASKFGLTPSDRARLGNAALNKQKRNPFAELATG